MKNVLFVVDEKRMGGVSILLSDILNKININNYQIDVLVLHNNGNYLDNLPENVNIIYGSKFFNTVDFTLKEVLKTKNPVKIYSKLRLIFMMKTKMIKKRIILERKKILKKKYDVEIAFKDGFTAIFTAYGDSLKKYHWLHSDYEMYDCTHNYHPLFEDVYKHFDKIIAISNSVLERFKTKYNVAKTDVIFNIIDENKIIEKSSLENITYDESKLNLISVGRIHNMKGYDRLIDVFHALDEAEKIDNTVLRIIGDGPDFELIKTKVKEYKLEDKVLILGSKKNPFPYVKASDCFIMCSRYEPFGLVILEALILKVPVLSVDVASIKEIMTEKYGFIYENSFNGLYNGILNVIENQKLLKEKKRNLNDYHYDIEGILKQIESLLDE